MFLITRLLGQSLNKRTSLTDVRGWILHRLISNYWSLALGAALLAPLIFAATLHLDRNGATDWLLDRDLSPAATAETARETASLIAGVDAAYLTLYFSISMIVLTIAAGNLGVRLIDRWLGKRLVRVSIAGLTFTTIHAVLVLSAIDAQAPLAETPLLTYATMILLLVVNTVMLAVAVHDLGRTMYVDKAIDTICDDGKQRPLDLAGSPATDIELGHEVRAQRSGYVEGTQLDQLAQSLSDCGRVRVCVAPGQHVLEGQLLLASERKCSDEQQILHAIPIGPFRSDTQGPVFQIRLLVEIAARALSPAVNDFYTALAAVDALTELARGHVPNWVDEGQVPVSAEHTNIELPGQDFRGLFEDPLAALRQSSADYPPVAIRLIGNLQRLVEVSHTAPDGFHQFLLRYVDELHTHAHSRCELDADRRALDRAREDFRMEAR